MHPIQPDISYPIFNHANGFENVSRGADYRYFFEKITIVLRYKLFQSLKLWKSW